MRISKDLIFVTPLSNMNLCTKTLLALLLLWGAVAQADDAQKGKEESGCVLWHKIEAAEGDIVFIAHQEANFIRAKIGEWLPLSLMKVTSGDGYFWRVQQIYRKNNELCIKIGLKNPQGTVGEINFDYYSVGKDEKNMEAMVSVKAGETRIVIHDSEGDRAILITSSKDKNTLAKKYPVSKAMPLWKWESAGVETKF